MTAAYSTRVRTLNTRRGGRGRRRGEARRVVRGGVWGVVVSWGRGVRLRDKGKGARFRRGPAGAGRRGAAACARRGRAYAYFTRARVSWCVATADAGRNTQTRT